MNRYFIKIILMLLLLQTGRLFAGINETLPSYHWTYRYIKEFQVRGYCLDLLQMHHPYTRGDVAKSLIKLKTQLDKSRNHPTFLSEKLQVLLKEFEPEVESLQQKDQNSDAILGRLYLKGDGNKNQNQSFEYRGVYRGITGTEISNNIAAYNSMIFDQYDYYDPDYVGKKWRGVVGYTEQAYVTGQWDKLTFKFGRDFLKWGVGNSGSLLLSNTYRPLDQFYAAARFGPFVLSFIAAELDRKRIRDNDSITRNYRRFLSGHRLDMSFWKGRLQAAVTEVILYGEANGGFNTTYLNPVIFYHGAKKNGAGDNNVLPTLDFLIYPLKNWQLYSSLLIDDIQVERTVPGDLEPTEYGLVLGTYFSDPFKLYGLTLNLEYARVSNRTYKTPHPEEIYIHRNKPMGHPLGHDFDHWLMGCSYWLKSDLFLGLEYSRTRHGEGDLFSPWDEPWMELTLDDEYSEPFPTGIIETTKQLKFEVMWYAKNWLRINGCLNYAHFQNENNIKGQKIENWESRLRLELDWTKIWSLSGNH